MNFEKLSDEEIISQFKNGNENAIDFLLSKYKNVVNSISRRYFLVGGEQEDLVQEGMIGLYKACLTYAQNKNMLFKSFAYLCIERRIQTAVRNANSQKNLILNNALSIDSKSKIKITSDEDRDEEESFIYIPSTIENPESKLIEKENYQEIINQIKYNLSEYEFEVLKLYLDGFRCEQISKLLKKDFKSTDNALVRIKNKLNFLRNNND